MSGQLAYRLGDGAPVGIDAARAIWTAVAREVLEEIPSAASVTRSELARQVQQRSGVYTRLPVSDWLPGIVAGLGDDELTARLRADAPPAAAPATARAGTRSGTRSGTAASRPRAEPRPRKRPEAPAVICPTCFMQLPASGRCDTCA